MGQGRIGTAHLPPGHSLSCRHVLPAFVPPRQRATLSSSQVPGAHAVSATPVHGSPARVPPRQRNANRFPVRKIFELSGTLRADVSPVLQSPTPAASWATSLMMHVLSCACGGFVTGSGGPNLQPAEVHVRSLPVSAWVVAPSVRVQLLVHAVTFESAELMSGTTDGSGTLTPPPPK